MKRILVFGVVLFVLVSSAASLFAGAQSEEKSYVLKIQHNSSEQHPWQQGFTYMKDELDKKFPGVFNVTIYPNGSLAGRDWKVILDQTQTDVVQMMCESSIPFATLQKELFVLNTPFLFSDMEHYLRFMSKRPDMVYKWFGKLEDKGVQVLAVWPRPFRQLLNSKRPILTPADISGLKFRVPGLDLFVKTFEAMGAKPVPMSSGEIYTAMQLGTVVGEDNSIGTVYDFKTFEQGKYFNIWNYMADGVLVVVNKDWYSGLDSKYQEGLKEVAMDAANVVYQAELDLQVKAKKNMEDFGIQFTVFDEEMKKPFKEKMAPVYKMLEEVVGPQDWAAFLKAVEEAR